MSKAFTRESDEPTVEEPIAAPRESQLPEGATNYITAAGARALREELDRLVQRERPEALAAVNAPGATVSVDVRRRLQDVGRHIRVLSEILESAEVVEPAPAGTARALFGATVTVRTEDEREVTYTIVGVDEVDVRKGRVSWLSPIARALLNASEGDVVTFRSPRGEEELEVLRVAYD